MLGVPGGRCRCVRSSPPRASIRVGGVGRPKWISGVTLTVRAHQDSGSITGQTLTPPGQASAASGVTRGGGHMSQSAARYPVPPRTRTVGTQSPHAPAGPSKSRGGGGMSLTRRTGNHARGASRQVRPELQLPPAGRIDPPGQLRSRPSPWSSPPQAATRGATAGLIPSGCGGARVHPESARQRLRIRGRGYLAVHLALSRAAYPSAAELTSGR